MRFTQFAGALVLVMCATAMFAGPVLAQSQPDSVAAKKAKKAEKAAKAEKSDSLKVPPLFTSEAPLVVTFTTNIKKLRADRDPKGPYHSATMSYVGGDGKTVTVPLKVKTHGIWRLKHCEFPPLRLNFSNKETKHTLFYDLQKPKLVNSCRDNDSYEQLALKEMQLYRIYQVLTPVSHRVRTLRIAYADSATGKVDATRYGFLFEDPDELADRLGGRMAKTAGASADDLDPGQAAIAYIFEYFIGNTDFSFNGVHNAELVMKSDGSQLLPVAYDFDFSGAVNAPYATVDPKLPNKRVIDRLFRGYCAHASSYPAAFALFRAKKDAIYALYHDDVGKLLDAGNTKKSLEFFDDFYDATRNAHDQEYVVSTCVGRH